MNLIIPLLGKSKLRLYNKKVFNNKKSQKVFLLDLIFDNYSFCDKIFLIATRKDIKKKIINFNKRSNVELIYSNKTPNILATLLKVKRKINFDNKILVLNPDSYFNFNKKLTKLKNNQHGIFFSINKEDIYRKFGAKDTFLLNKENKIKRVLYKSNPPFKNNVSAGLYLFKEWRILINEIDILKKNKLKKKNFANLLDQISRKYNFISKSIDNFVCFETDSKLKEYEFWNNYFKINFKIKDKLKTLKIQNIIPAAGEGSRHKHLGYNLPKPLIPVSNKTMFEQSLSALPNPNRLLAIFRENTFKKYRLKKKLKFKKNKIFSLVKRKTRGMAITVYKAKQLINLNNPVLISSCDIKCVIDYKKFYSLIKSENPDGIIFTWKNYPFASESPNSHAYILEKNNRVFKIQEKKPVSKNPDKDNAVTGVFYFKSGRELLNCIEFSIKNKITINGEYYIATSMIKLIQEKKKVLNFNVNQFISWSLPEHLEDYNYWEKKFL